MKIQEIDMKDFINLLVESLEDKLELSSKNLRGHIDKNDEIMLLKIEEVKSRQEEMIEHQKVTNGKVLKTEDDIEYLEKREDKTEWILRKLSKDKWFYVVALVVSSAILSVILNSYGILEFLKIIK